jgi:hypothetical protein
MTSSRRGKFARVVLVTIVCIVCGIALFLYAIMPHPALTLFLGYVGVTNGISIARFSMLNHSARPVEYLSDGPVIPYYYLMRLLAHDTNTGVMAFTNYHPLFSISATNSTIPAGGNVSFDVPMVAGTTNISIGVHYLPQRPAVRVLMRELQILFTGGSSTSYENVELRAPFR